MSRVLGRNFFAFIIGVALAFRAHSGGWENPHPICNGGWAEFLAYFMQFALGLVSVEILHWTVWYIREGRQWQERPIALESDAPLLRGGELFSPHRLILGFVFPFGILWIAQRYLPVPDPCASARFGYFSWRSILGSVLFAYGVLAFGEYAVYAISRRKRGISPPPTQ